MYKILVIEHIYIFLFLCPMEETRILFMTLLALCAFILTHIKLEVETMAPVMFFTLLSFYVRDE